MLKTLKIDLNIFFLYMLFFGISLSGAGFYLFNYLVNPLLIGFFILIFYGFKNKKIDLSLFLLITIFLFICIFSNLGRHSAISYLPSFIVISLLIVPLAITINDKNGVSIKLLFQSFYLICVICLFEFVLNFFSPELWQLIEKIFFLQGDTVSYFNIARLKGAMIEPSVLGIVLVYYFFCFFYLQDSGIRNCKKEKIICLFLITLTFSTSAYIMLASLLFLLLFNQILNVFIRLKIKAFFLSFIITLLVISLIVIFFFSESAVKTIDRLVFAIENINQLTYIGSVGYRINSFFAGFNYFLQAESYEFFLGEGFSNYSDWIITNYGYVTESPFSEGAIANMLSAVGISMGILGLLSFGSILFAISKPFKNNYNFMFFILNLYFCISYANMTAPIFFGAILFTKIIIETISYKLNFKNAF